MHDDELLQLDELCQSLLEEVGELLELWVGDEELLTEVDELKAEDDDDAPLEELEDGCDEELEDGREEEDEPLDELAPAYELLDDDEPENPEELEDDLQGPEADELLLDEFTPRELLELDSLRCRLELDEDTTRGLLEELLCKPDEELRPLDEDGPPPPLLDEPVELLGGGDSPLLEDGGSDEPLDGPLPLLVEEGSHDELLNQPLEDIGLRFHVGDYREIRYR